MLFFSAPACPHHCQSVCLNMRQEMLLNLLLRNYLHYNLYELAEKLRSKALRPETHSNQQVRF